MVQRGQEADRRELDAQLIETVRRGRRRKSHVVSRKPPKPENAKGAATSAKKLA
jgi:hypothetical protein